MPDTIRRAAQAAKDQAIPQILYGNGPQRYRSPVESALVGGILGGLLGWLFGDRRRGSG